MHSQRENSPPSGGGQAFPGRNINGRKLAKALKAGTVQPGFAAWLAVKLQTGGAFVHHLTDKQSRLLTNARRADVAAERRKHQAANGNGSNGKHQDRLFYRKRPTDSDLDAAVAHHGARLMQAIDRATRPPRCEATGEMFTR